MNTLRTPREWRARAGLSQDDIAKRARIDRSTVGAIEAGNPGTVASAGKYAKAINGAIFPSPCLSAADIVAGCELQRERDKEAAR